MRAIPILLSICKIFKCSFFPRFSYWQQSSFNTTSFPVQMSTWNGNACSAFWIDVFYNHRGSSDFTCVTEGKRRKVAEYQIFWCIRHYHHTIAYSVLRIRFQRRIFQISGGRKPIFHRQSFHQILIELHLSKGANGSTTVHKYVSTRWKSKSVGRARVRRRKEMCNLFMAKVPFSIW